MNTNSTEEYMLNLFPNKETTFLLRGPAGQLECIAGVPKEGSKNITAIICHPHPQQEGTMNNKVVYTLAKTFEQIGCHTVRFNYRGVGQSEGSFGDGIGELDDLKAIVNWVKQVRPKDELWLAGFSFGGFISLKASNLWPIKKLISIAPPAGHEYFIDIPEVLCDWILVQGEDDEVVMPDNVYSWIEDLDRKPQLIKIPECGHFFHRKLVVLRNELLRVL